MPHATFTRARLQAMAALLGGLVLWWRLRSPWSLALAGVMAGLALLAWIAPERHKPVQRVFDGITRGVVAAFTWLILGAVYFGLFTPMRLFGALSGRDPLRMKRDRMKTTYFCELPPASARRFDRQF